MTRLKTWVEDHDDRWSFTLVYIGGAIILSIFMSLFWVLLLMLAHLGLETLRNHLMKLPRPVLQALWHVKLDMALMLFALAITLYAELIIAALGLGQAARGGVQATRMAARFGIIKRALRVVLLTVDEVALLLRAVLRGARRKKAAQQQLAGAGLPENTPPPDTELPWRSPTWGDKAAIGFAVLCASLMLAAPWLADMSYPQVGRALFAELQP